MDTSKEYIKMCDCPEIQDKRFNISIDKVLVCNVCGTRAGNCLSIPDDEREHRFVWVARQDQLQEMMSENPKASPTLLHFLNSFIESIEMDKPRYTKYFKTFEQLWLAFVMKEKYNKTWNGDNWV